MEQNNLKGMHISVGKKPSEKGWKFVQDLKAINNIVILDIPWSLCLRLYSQLHQRTIVFL